ncbi:cell wall hydrolase [Halonatronum saccharophilum]|uniref:cell wall hydrolase n=1 Tax=Halonatronum saccharophilum TaxID=150060 RepID=UPI000483A4BE|nr:cell wall hydrolase [Halonatronum saccharophilum]
MKKRLSLIILFLVLFIGFGNVALASFNFDLELIYTVEQGDNLITLARKFGTTVNEIREANNLSRNQFIRMGDRLIIPQNYESEDDQVNMIKFYERDNDLSRYSLAVNRDYRVRIEKNGVPDDIDISDLRTLEYNIKRGDNLYDLAREFNTSVNVLKRLNGLDSAVIRLGDMIKLPINNLTPKEVLYHTISDEEFELLARIIHGEARGEPYVGQVAVGAVVLNRVLDPYFPNNLRDVIYQPRQFSPVADGQIYLRPNQTAYRAARAALKGEDPTRGAVYFHNPRTANYIWWFETRETTVDIGNHRFAK